MGPCPSDDDLERFSAGEPSTTVGLHLRGCERCRSVVDRISSEDTLRDWAASLASRRRDEGDDVALSGLVEALCKGRSTAEWEGEARPAGPTGVAPKLDSPEAPGDLGTLGPFAVEAEVGRGGVGIVYRARDRRVGRLVALKVLRPELADDQARRRFVREVRAAARVENDHVVRVYAASDPSDPTPYLVMEYIAGPSLAEEIRVRRRLGPREAAAVVAQAADGLSAAHAAGLVHRDVKPANILIDPATGRAKVGDFGLARLAAEFPDLTRDGVIAGTPAYLSPEQARGEPDVGPAADVYAMGVTLYECLTGEPPFRGTPHRIIHQILHDEPRPPRALNDAVPRDLETICLKAMAGETGRRYGSAAELAADLRRWLAGEPIRARPVGPAGRLWRACRRHPRVATLVAALVAVLVGGVAGILWQWRRAEVNAREYLAASLVAARNAGRARDYLRRTLNSVDQYFTKVSESRLLNVPNLQPLRKELLQAARGYYEDLLRDRPDDPEIRTALAGARTRLAAVVGLVGSYDEALEMFRRALAEYDWIIGEAPGDVGRRYGRNACLMKIGAAQLNASKLDDAMATYRRLLAECESLRRERPEDLEPLEGAYAARHGIARVASMKGADIDQLIANYEAALAVNRELLSRKPGHAAYLRNMTRSSGFLTELYPAKGRLEDGRSTFRDAYRAARRLVAEHPDSLDYRFSLAIYEAQRGAAAAAESATIKGPDAIAKLDEARRAFADGLALDRALAKENPQVDVYRLDLLGILSRAAALELVAGRLDACLALVGEARSIFDAIAHRENNYPYVKPEMSGILLTSAYALSQEGRLAEALKALDEGETVLKSMTPQERSAEATVVYRDGLLHNARAAILWDAGRLSESLPFWDRAREALPPLRPILDVARELVRAEAAHGSPPDPHRALAAVPLADSVCNSEPLPACADVLYAKIYAVAAGAAADEATRESLEARAVLRLEKARDAGYFRDPRRFERVEADPSLDRLRDRRDYRELKEQARGRSTAG